MAVSPVPPSVRAAGSPCAAELALDKLARDWPQMREGALSGELAYAGEPVLWERVVCDAPLGTYGRMAASFLNREVRPGHTVVELGAGVGAASRHLRFPDRVRYLRTDLNPFLLRRKTLPGVPKRYDFDQPSSLRGADMVFAVNALHCAADPRRSLRHVHAMLREGGRVLLAEGHPKPSPEHPWALDFLTCQFKGWWDRTGFRNREAWTDDLRAAGFRRVQFRRLAAGAHDLGGLIWAHR
jgi:SAM-dependent methyltransferase